MLSQSLVRKYHFASGYSTLQYLNDGKIWAKNINGLRIKRHSKVVDFKGVPAWVVVDWGGGSGEVLLSSVPLMEHSGKITSIRFPE